MDISDWYTRFVKATERDRALELRIKHQLGYSAIAKQVSVSKGTLARWLKHLPLSEERIVELRRKSWTKGEAQRERIRETKRKKREVREQEVYLQMRKRFAKISSQALFVAGLMLYHAEGDKKDFYHMGIANTDPQIIKFFVWWLQKFMGIPRSRMKVQLHLYESMNLVNERKFWIKQTGLPEHQFYKDQVRPIRPGSFSYSESFRHGTCKIYVYGLKESRELMLSIKAFFDRHNELRV